MVDRSFNDEHGDALDGLRRARGTCPEPDVLLDYAAGTLQAGRARDIEAHLSLCPSCEEAVTLARRPVEEVDELTWQRAQRALDRRPSPWQRKRRHWNFAVASAAAILAVALLWPLAGNRDSTPIDPQTRGAVLTLEPTGTAQEVDRFRWQPVPLASAYRVTVELSDGTRWQRTSPDNQLEIEPSSDLFPSGRHRWRVEALDDEDTPFAASSWQPFQIER